MRASWQFGQLIERTNPALRQHYKGELTDVREHHTQFKL